MLGQDVRSGYEELLRYFDEVDQRTGRNLARGSEPVRKTAVGEFCPTPLREIHPCIESLIERRMVDSAGRFLDAGSGDGRIVALMVGAFRIPSTGVEYDRHLVKESSGHLLTLQEVFGDVPVRIIRGDFTENATYERANIRFRDFRTEVAQESLSGTVFLTRTWFHPERHYGLTHVQTLKLAGPPKDTMLHVYRKE